MELKDKIYAFIKERQHVSYAELSRDIPGFAGDMEYGTRADGHNIVFWAGISNEAIEALMQLMKEEQIIPANADLLVYLIDGVTLKYPIQKNNRKHKKPHWAPITFTTKEFSNSVNRRR